MKKLFVLFLAVALLLGGCSVQRATPEASTQTPATTVEPETPIRKENGVFGLSYLNAYGLNPYTCTSTVNRALLSLLYESLFVVSDRYRAEPVLCDTFTVSDDGKTYTIRLVSGVRFSNGIALTAEDVVASLNAAKDSSIYRARLAHLAYAEATSNDTVVLTLTTAYENFCLMLDVPIVRATTVERAEPLGTGPYCLANSGKELRRNSYWWQDGAPVVDEERIALNRAENSTQIRDAFEFGGTDLVYCDPNSPAAVSYRCDYEIWSAPTTVMHYIGFNLYSGYFVNDTLRTAVTKAVDRDTLVQDVYGGFAEAAVLPCSPRSDLYDTALAAGYTYTEQAFAAAVHNSEILSSENYVGHVGLFLVCSEDPVRVKAAEQICQVLTDAGLSMKMSVLDRDAYLQALKDGDFDLYYGEVRLTPNFDLREFFREDGALGYGSISDAALTAYCNSALENSGNYVDLCRELLARAPICPVVFKDYAVYVTRGRIRTLTPTVDCVFHNSADARSLSDAQVYDTQ